MGETPLWTLADMAAAMQADASGRLPPAVDGLSIDTRTIRPGDAFFAIRGDARDGHDFVMDAVRAGAGLAVVSADRRDDFPDEAPLLVVADVLEALRALAVAARARTDARIVAVTGSVGKTSTKEALLAALSRDGRTHASVASYNNHWGVPLSLARCPADARYAVFEIGMNHAGEIGPLARLVRPHVALITTVEPVHLEFFASVEAIADAKGEIFEGLEAGGVAVLNRDNAQFERLAALAEAAGAKVVGFGESRDAQARLVGCALRPDCSAVQADILGTDVTYKLGAPGRHQVQNSLAVLAAVALLGGDLALAAIALADLAPAKGRGTRITLDLPGGTALLIDESYNANPASMRAALALLGQSQTEGRGRRIAVLGDMLELGQDATALHAAMANAVTEHAVDLVFCAGPLMRHMWEALPSNRRGGYADTAAALEPRLREALQPGDVMMVKGSNSSRMGPLVASLARRFAVPDAPDAAPSS